MPIADNRSSFAVILRRDEIAEPAASLRSLAQLISLDASEMDRMMVGTTRHPTFVPVVVREDLSWQQVAMIEVNLPRSEEHTSELQSLMRISYAVFCLKKKKTNTKKHKHTSQP